MIHWHCTVHHGLLQRHMIPALLVCALCAVMVSISVVWKTDCNMHQCDPYSPLTRACPSMFIEHKQYFCLSIFRLLYIILVSFRFLCPHNLANPKP
jgi:hypothetical protein